MNRRALIVFVILNIAISVGVAMLVIAWWQQNNPNDCADQPVAQVFEVVITATPGATQTPWVVTVVGDAPAVAAAPTNDPDEPTVAPTLVSDILPNIATEAAATQSAIAVSGSAEETYIVQAGDNPSIIAESLGVTLEDFLCANDLGTIDNPSFIYEGQTLLVPGPDFECGSSVVVIEEPTAEPESINPDETATPVPDTPVPTVTLAPTAEDALVGIMQVVGVDDITSEGVVLQNQGGLVQLQGWTLFDTQGNIFSFPEYRLFPNASVTVFTRVGENTPAALYWSETRAVWQTGDVVSLADADGTVQASYRIE